MKAAIGVVATKRINNDDDDDEINDEKYDDDDDKNGRTAHMGHVPAGAGHAATALCL